MPVLVSVSELAEQGHKSPDKLYELARRKEDPLPIRYFDGDKRYGVLLVSEFTEWFLRNSVLYSERN